MRRLFSEYAMVCLELICGILILGIFITTTKSDEIKRIISKNNHEDGLVPFNTKVEVNEVDFVVNNASVAYGDEFNYLDYIEAYNNKGEDIKSFVSVLNDIDTTKVGENVVKYVLRYNGQNIYKTGYYYVLESDDNL